MVLKQKNFLNHSFYFVPKEQPTISHDTLFKLLILIYHSCANSLKLGSYEYKNKYVCMIYLVMNFSNRHPEIRHAQPNPTIKVVPIFAPIVYISFIVFLIFLKPQRAQTIYSFKRDNNKHAFDLFIVQRD